MNLIYDLQARQIHLRNYYGTHSSMQILANFTDSTQLRSSASIFSAKISLASVLAPPRFRMPDKPARNILCLGVRALAWPALVSRRNIQILAHLY